MFNPVALANSINPSAQSCPVEQCFSSAVEAWVKQAYPNGLPTHPHHALALTQQRVVTTLKNDNQTAGVSFTMLRSAHEVDITPKPLRLALAELLSLGLVDIALEHKEKGVLASALVANLKNQKSAARLPIPLDNIQYTLSSTAVGDLTEYEKALTPQRTTCLILEVDTRGVSSSVYTFEASVPGVKLARAAAKKLKKETVTVHPSRPSTPDYSNYTPTRNSRRAPVRKVKKLPSPNKPPTGQTLAEFKKRWICYLPSPGTKRQTKVTVVEETGGMFRVGVFGHKDILTADLGLATMCIEQIDAALSGQTVEQCRESHLAAAKALGVLSKT